MPRNASLAVWDDAELALLAHCSFDPTAARFVRDDLMLSPVARTMLDITREYGGAFRAVGPVATVGTLGIIAILDGPGAYDALLALAEQMEEVTYAELASIGTFTTLLRTFECRRAA